MSERLLHSTNSQKWSLMPERRLLGETDVHVWRVDLNQPAAMIEHCRELLSKDEQARANRFHFESDRQHFIVARGFLRAILASYLEISAQAIQFSYASHGKPELANSYSHELPLNFNLAHSGSFALYGVTRMGEIGVDLEHIRSDFTGDDIARRFFSSNEVGCLTSLPADVRHEAFFNCWTRKEAFLKAKGTGLSLPLDQFDVTLAPAEPAALLLTRWDETEATRWSLKSIDVAPGYVAAVAV
ncbi:MAG: 4'-phosphopantetheinyl transferase superfamily protein, partial [Pyrinomonadaceae bacterium]